MSPLLYKELFLIPLFLKVSNLFEELGTRSLDNQTYMYLFDNRSLLLHEYYMYVQ